MLLTKIRIPSPASNLVHESEWGGITHILITLGDSLLIQEWSGLNPDVLMLPIGGKKLPNTMDVEDALNAVRMISPNLVIPCHYNTPYSFIRNVNPTDDQLFKSEVEKMGIPCRIMKYGEEIDY